MPTLIREGKVYIAESPLYEINTKDETWFCYTEKEKQEALTEIGDKKYTIQRSKGLGENEPEMMWQPTMNPATRRLIQVSPTDAEQTAYIFETLLGDDLAERKDFIRKNGKPEGLAAMWCRWPGSNRHGNFFPQDFKSWASANSATSAYAPQR